MATARGSCRCQRDADVATVEIIPDGTDHIWSTASFE